MSTLTNAELGHRFEAFIAATFQSAGMVAINDFHTVLQRRIDHQLGLLERTATAGSATVILELIAAAMTATVGTGMTAPVVLNPRGEARRHIERMQTLWTTWWNSYYAKWQPELLRQADEFATLTRQNNPELLAAESWPAWLRRFLEKANAPCPRYLYVRVWNHLAYQWDRACLRQVRASGDGAQGAALEGPNGMLMPCRTLGQRDAYDTPLPTVADAEARRAARPNALPGASHLMPVTNP